MHINYQELLGIKFAFQTLTNGKTNITVLRRFDNMSGVGYINNLGGIVSLSLLSLAKGLLMWFQNRNIYILSQHLQGNSIRRYVQNHAHGEIKQTEN